MKYFGVTNKGLVRKNNQDSYVIATNENGDVFAIVCDGIGGNVGGDVASRMAVAHISKAFSENNGFPDELSAKNWIQKTISQVNSEIYDFGIKHTAFKGMGTTFCGVMITGQNKYFVNVGDSRAYAYWKKDKSFKQISHDHTLVNEMLDHGELTQEEAENFPRKNVLTNALGVWETVRSDIELHNEDMSGMLICSDGLHGYVEEEKIKSIIFDESMDEPLRCKKLVQASFEAGGYDNVTVILIDLEGGGLQ